MCSLNVVDVLIIKVLVVSVKWDYLESFWAILQGSWEVLCASWDIILRGYLTFFAPSAKLVTLEDKTSEAL